MDMDALGERLKGLTLFLDLLQEHRVLMHQNCTLDFVGLPGSGTVFLGAPLGRPRWLGGDRPLTLFSQRPRR